MYTIIESKIVNVKTFKKSLKRIAQNVYGNMKLLSELQTSITQTKYILIYFGSD